MWLRADRSGDGKPQLWRAETQLRRPQTRQLDRSSGENPLSPTGGGLLTRRPAATFRQPGRVPHAARRALKEAFDEIVSQIASFPNRHESDS